MNKTVETEMVKRVARAILEQVDAGSPYFVVARATIEAMREPTEEMREAVWDLLQRNAVAGNLRPGSIRGNGMPDALLSVLIDAAVSSNN